MSVDIVLDLAEISFDILDFSFYVLDFSLDIHDCSRRGHSYMQKRVVTDEVMIIRSDCRKLIDK
jgi:hypothetical protein